MFKDGDFAVWGAQGDGLSDQFTSMIRMQSAAYRSQAGDATSYDDDAELLAHFDSRLLTIYRRGFLRFGE